MSKLIFQNKSQFRDWVFAQAPLLRRPAVVLLDGNLGAGKTQTVRWFAESLGAIDVASPTFAIHLEYETPEGLIDHVDLYRVTSDADLEASGFWDLFRNPQGLVFVEWADRLPPEVWPKDWARYILKINKLKSDEDGREVHFEALLRS